MMHLLTNASVSLGQIASEHEYTSEYFDSEHNESDR